MVQAESSFGRWTGDLGRQSLGYRVLGVAAAVGLWAAALGLRFALVGLLPAQGFPFLTFFPAVMVAAYLFGLVPGLVCAVLSVGAAYAFFIPHGSQGVGGLSSGDLIALVFFTAILVVDCLILHLLARSRLLVAQRERELRELTDNSPDVLTRYDPQLRHLFASGALSRLTGRRSEEFIGKTHRQLGMRSELAEPWEQALRATFADGSPRSLDFEFEGRHFAAELVPEFDRAHARVKSVVAIARDVTQLMRQQRELEAHDRSKDRMLATVAHELRNPLSTLAHGVLLLKRQMPETGQVATVLAAMERQTAQMTRIVGDLMDLSRIRANLVDLSLSRIDLRFAIDAAVESCHDAAQRQMVTVERALPTHDMVVDGDSNRLIQIFGNLLSNAVKFSPRGGVVRVTARVLPDTFEVVVADQGAGIAPETLETVFDAFVQGEAGRDLHSGLGIGLSVVRQLVALHGGTVRAESAGRGQGASFIVRLPHARQGGPA